MSLFSSVGNWLCDVRLIGGAIITAYVGYKIACILATNYVFPVNSRFNCYHYRSLPDKRHIRLVRLHRDGKPSLTTCELATFEIDSCPTYIALSYTWGEAIDWTCDSTSKPSYNRSVEHLTCDGSLLRVSGNLVDFLRVWKVQEEGDWIWIDALSINQD